MGYGPARVLGEFVSQVVTWKQYGAIGDGVADDAAAINACMLAASLNGYVVAAGVADERFRITAPINIYDNTRLYGRGKGVTVVAASRCPGFDMASSTDVVTGLTADFAISGLTVIGDDDVASDGLDHIGLHLRRATRYRIEDVEIKGFTDACVIDGRKNTAGTSYGNADGRFIDCEFETDFGSPQSNPTNNYPRYLVEIAAETNGVGGADGVSFYNCRLYGEVLIDTELRAGDGATTSFSFGPIVAGKTLTSADHVTVEYVAGAGSASIGLTNGIEFTVDGDTDPTAPVFDFSVGSAPIGPLAQIVLLATTGDGATRNFRLGARPSFRDPVGGRGVRASVDGASLSGGNDYDVVDGSNKKYSFVADDGNDSLTIESSGASELATGRIVRVSSTGALPAGLSADVDYYATEIEGATCKLAASYSDALAVAPTIVDVTDVGSGAHTISVENAIEFASAPGGGLAVSVDDENLRLRWIDPNVEACAKLCRGAERIGFFSCLFGGGKVGLDFSHAKRCTAVDAYFQIHGWAVQFDQDAAENQLLGFSSRTDQTLLNGFVNDLSTAETNAFDSFLARGSSVRDYLFIKESFDEDSSGSGRLRKVGGQVQLDAQDAAGSVRLGVAGANMLLVNGDNGRISMHDSLGAELWRFNAVGNASPRLASGVQSLGDESHLLNQVYANGVVLYDGVTAPAATSGLAKLFVDAADGDLKIVFGDGATKTIVTDS